VSPIQIAYMLCTHSIQANHSTTVCAIYNCLDHKLGACTPLELESESDGIGGGGRGLSTGKLNGQCSDTLLYYTVVSTVLQKNLINVIIRNWRLCLICVEKISLSQSNSKSHLH